MTLRDLSECVSEQFVKEYTAVNYPLTGQDLVEFDKLIKILWENADSYPPQDKEKIVLREVSNSNEDRKLFLAQTDDLSFRGANICEYLDSEVICEVDLPAVEQLCAFILSFLFDNPMFFPTEEYLRYSLVRLDSPDQPVTNFCDHESVVVVDRAKAKEIENAFFSMSEKDFLLSSCDNVKCLVFAYEEVLLNWRIIGIFLDKYPQVESIRVTKEIMDKGDYFTCGGALFHNRSNETVLKACPPARIGTYKVPYGVTHISSFAFSNSKLSRVILPESTAVVDEFAFYRADNMKYVFLPSPHIHIWNKAFEGCPYSVF